MTMLQIAFLPRLGIAVTPVIGELPCEIAPTLYGAVNEVTRVDGADARRVRLGAILDRLDTCTTRTPRYAGELQCIVIASYTAGRVCGAARRVIAQ